MPMGSREFDCCTAWFVRRGGIAGERPAATGGTQVREPKPCRPFTKAAPIFLLPRSPFTIGVSRRGPRRTAAGLCHEFRFDEAITQIRLRFAGHSS